MSRDYGLYLDDIESSCVKVMTYVEGLTRESFSANAIARDAVLHNLFVIGEAANNIPDAMQEANPDIPWRRLVGLRNVIAHGYFDLAQDAIWAIVQDDVPVLLTQVRQIKAG